MASNSVSITPGTPVPPAIDSITSGNGQAIISFTPGVDNGSSITNYEYSLDGVNYTALDPADVTSPITITGLTNGAEYSITLRALNGNGEGAVSGSVSVTPAGLPTAPQITNTDYGNEEIYLTVSVANNGGSTISSYTATCTDGTTQYTGTSSTSRITVSGLTNGVGYSCSVRATNAAGTSTASATSPPIVPEYIPTGLPIWLLYEASEACVSLSLHKHPSPPSAGFFGWGLVRSGALSLVAERTLGHLLGHPPIKHTTTYKSTTVKNQ